MNNTSVRRLSIVMADLYLKYGALSLQLYSKNKHIIQKSKNPIQTLKRIVMEAVL